MFGHRLAQGRCVACISLAKHTIKSFNLKLFHFISVLFPFYFHSFQFPFSIFHKLYGDSKRVDDCETGRNE